jgi:hypothetical protein
MAYHADPAHMVVESIDEYLLMAEYGVNYQKTGGGILGYPTALLLLSVIDILGSYAVSTKEHFQVLQHPCFGLPLSPGQVKDIEHWYRNLLAHNGFIALGALMRPDETGDPFVLDENGQPTILRVKPLFRAVKLAWERFDRSQIKPERHLKQNHYVAKPIDLTGSPASEIAVSSGAYIDPKRFIRNM